MTSMDQIHRIRDLYYGQDKSLTEIAGIEKLVTVHGQYISIVKNAENYFFILL